MTNLLIGVVLVMTTFQLPFATFVVQNSFAAIPEDFGSRPPWTAPGPGAHFG